MAAYTITAAEVTPGSGAAIEYGTLGEAVTAGQAIYLKASDGKLWLAQSDGTSAEAAAVGIAIAGGAAGQRIGYVKQGTLNLDTAALTGGTKGDIVVLGTTAGGLFPSADLASSDFVTVLGVLVTANPGVMSVGILASGVEI